MNEEGPELNPLLSRVDALLRRHHEMPRGIDDDVPVLTEVAEPAEATADPIDGKAVAALAEALERAVLDRLGNELDRIIDERLDQALRELRSALGQNVRQMVREAVAASVTQALAEYRNPEGKTDVA